MQEEVKQKEVKQKEVKQDELKREIKKKIDGLNDQIHQLKVQVVDASLKDSYDKLIQDLEETRDLIREKYRLMERSGAEDWTALDKNIYTDLETFRASFNRAGAMFKPRQKNS